MDTGGRETGPGSLTEAQPSSSAVRLLRLLSMNIRDSRQWFWRLMDSAREYKQRQTMDADAALGRRGENQAHRYLRSHGMTVVARNVRLPDGSGEIDIVARDAAITVFVEVKARMTDAFGAPERAIDKEKQERITRAARFYASRSGVSWDSVRFDVVSIVFTRPPSVSHYADAFFLGRAR